MAQKKKGGGFFSGLSKAVEGVASSIDKAAKSVSSDVANATLNPMDHLKSGNVLTIVARSCYKSVVVDSSGVVWCNGHPTQVGNLGAQFEVVASPHTSRAYKLRSVAYPQFHLGIVNGYFIGNGQGGQECDFYIHLVPASSSIDIPEYVTFESAMTRGSHVGVLPTGQFTAPAQTSPQTGNAAHFKLKYITHRTPPAPATGDPPPQGVPPTSGAPPYQQGYAPPQGYSPGPPPHQGVPPTSGAPPYQQGYAPPQGYSPGPPPNQGAPPTANAPPPYQQGYPPPANAPPLETKGYPPPSAPPPQQ